MKKIFVLLFLSISYGLFSQTQILTEPNKLSTINEYENSIGSLSKGFQSFNPYYDEDFEDIFENWPQVIYKPLIYKRINDDFFPTLHVWYFYDKDFIVKWVFYNWGFANTNVEVNDSIIMKQTLRENEYKKKYKIEKQNLINILGKPTKEDILNETSSYLCLKSVWDFKDKRVVIDMTIDKQVAEVNSKKISRSIIIPRSQIIIKILMKE